MITSAVRRSFPISTSFSKILDLDRCYSVSRIPVDGGKELVVYSVHMSAYGNSDEIREGQTSMLFNDMKEERQKGNYVICGGDFNHNLKLDENDNAEHEGWAYPFFFVVFLDAVLEDDVFPCVVFLLPALLPATCLSASSSYQ